MRMRTRSRRVALRGSVACAKHDLLRLCALSHCTAHPSACVCPAAQFKTFTLKFLIIKTAFTFAAVVRAHTSLHADSPSSDIHASVVVRSALLLSCSLALLLSCFCAPQGGFCYYCIHLDQRSGVRTRTHITHTVPAHIALMHARTHARQTGDEGRGWPQRGRLHPLPLRRHLRRRRHKIRRRIQRGTHTHKRMGMHTHARALHCTPALLTHRFSSALSPLQQYRCHMTHEASMEYLKAMVYFVGGVLARTHTKTHTRMHAMHGCAYVC